MAYFDPTRPGYLANPYPSLARLRRDDPIHRSAMLGGWVVTGYADCARVLNDRAHFTADPSYGVGPRAEVIAAHRASVPLGNTLTLGTSGGSHHTRLRHIVNPLFSPGAVQRLRPEIEAAADALVDAISGDESFDLMAAVADPLPQRVMLRVIGVPDRDATRVRRWFATIEHVRTVPGVSPGMVAEARSARAAATAFLATYAEGGLPRDSVLAALLRASGAEGGLSHDEVLSLAVHIAMVGTGPSSALIANGTLALIEHPEQMTLVAQGGLLTRAVHELLRFDSPTHAVPRIARQETTLGSRRVRKGDLVLAMVGAANRDPAVFADPDRLDVRRDARKHLGFGMGEHICLGAPLARLIGEVSIRTLLRRFDRLRLAEQPRFAPLFELRVPERLIVAAA